MTILGPLVMIGVVWARLLIGNLPEDPQHVQVVDESYLLKGRLESSKTVLFTSSDKSIDQARKQFYASDYSIILYIPRNIIHSQTIQLFYKKQPAFSVQDYIRSKVSEQVEELKLIASGVDRLQLDLIKTDITVALNKVEKSGVEKKKNNELSFVVGLVGSILIYFFIFLYGAQVMRGVIEEKTSRIVEVVISSVKPFELMMGKILGIALVGLTQFALWLVLTFGGISLISKWVVAEQMNPKQLEQTMKQSSAGQPFAAPTAPTEIKDPAAALDSINWPLMLGCFLFYFLGGYLLYGALFAAIGSAVDSETDTQQFMLPLTIPMVLAISLSQVILTNPESSLGYWFSMIPLTSPIIMMIRVPFGVPVMDLVLSMSILIICFIGSTWLSARIYRTGILMYGKKNSYRELWKWLFYKS